MIFPSLLRSASLVRDAGSGSDTAFFRHIRQTMAHLHQGRGSYSSLNARLSFDATSYQLTLERVVELLNSADQPASTSRTTCCHRLCFQRPHFDSNHQCKFQLKSRIRAGRPSRLIASMRAYRRRMSKRVHHSQPENNSIPPNVAVLSGSLRWRRGTEELVYESEDCHSLGHPPTQSPKLAHESFEAYQERARNKALKTLSRFRANGAKDRAQKANYDSPQRDAISIAGSRALPNFVFPQSKALDVNGPALHFDTPIQAGEPCTATPRAAEADSNDHNTLRPGIFKGQGACLNGSMTSSDWEGSLIGVYGGNQCSKHPARRNPRNCMLSSDSVIHASSSGLSAISELYADKIRSTQQRSHPQTPKDSSATVLEVPREPASKTRSIAHTLRFRRPGLASLKLQKELDARNSEDRKLDSFAKRVGWKRAIPRALQSLKARVNSLKRKCQPWRAQPAQTRPREGREIVAMVVAGGAAGLSNSYPSF